MSVLFVLVPVALGLVLVAVGAYVWSARSGQFDDLDTPALRPLIDDTADGIAKSRQDRQI